MNLREHRPGGISLKSIAISSLALGIIAIFTLVYLYNDNSTLMVGIAICVFLLTPLAIYALYVAARREEIERQLDELYETELLASRRTMLTDEWNRPGRFVSGRLYKFTTVNLVAIGLGSALVAISAFFALKPNNIASPIPGDSGLVCGSHQFPAERQTYLRPNYSEYGVVREVDYSAEIECIQARSSSRDRSYLTGFPGFALLAISILVGTLRNPENTPWGPLQRRPKDQERTSETRAGEATGNERLAPGWYPDQSDQDSLRWFDGNEWTNATLPRQGWGTRET